MEARTVTEVEGWESRPFSGGYDGLHDLADGEFSGAVVAGDSYLFMVAGRVIGTFDYAESATGEVSVEPAPIDRFEDADGTAYVAPHDALALLYAMAATGGETRGRYYSQKTAIEEVDRTLKDGGFTGYLELSENVLSGDYYLVYHRGRRRSVAFVGQSRRLKTDDEAFDLANDEVGIYEVNAVRLSPTEIPGSPSRSGAGVPGADPMQSGSDTTDGERITDADVASAELNVDGTDEVPPDDEPVDEVPEPTSTERDTTPRNPEIDLDAALNARKTGEKRPSVESETDEPSQADADGGTTTAEPSPTTPLDRTDGEEDEPTDEGDGATSEEGEPTDGDGATPDEDSSVKAAISAIDGDEPDEPTSEATQEDIEAATAAAEAALDTEEEASASSGGRIDESHVVPSIDPDRTARAVRPTAAESQESARGRMVDGETVAGLRSELLARESRIEELSERLDAVVAERDELHERVGELERRLEESGSAPLENGRELSPAEALSGTTVLVGYESRAAPTLAAVHEGSADREALTANLVLETHTTFDTEGLAVSGLTFDTFFERSQAYRFLQWLVGSFLYEVQATGNVEALKPLYDALPSLHRVEFDATVTLEGGDRETARFDLVGRDDRGNPLFVGHLEDDRAPTTAKAVTSFLTDATAAAESHDSLVAAFSVTASYFEEDARETVKGATGTSLLSRNKRKSFVSTSRRGGYHLCLVRDRENSFYLAVPEL